MLTVRKNTERGHANHGWLDTHHTFSFSSYYDSEYMGFSNLRVINDDRVIPDKGFPTHGHKDMEIISYVLDGKMEHKDSMGNGSVIHAGEVQVMSAGTGVTHSEFNPSKDQALRFLQIWIVPDENNLKPSYQQFKVNAESIKGSFYQVASNNPINGAATIHQNADVYICKLDKNDRRVSHKFKSGRKGWIQIATGSLTINNLELTEGDGVAITDEQEIELKTNDNAHVLLFDLA